MTNIEALLRQAVGKLHRNDVEGRLRIYDAARSAMARMSPDTRARSLKALHDCVIRIEAEFDGHEGRSSTDHANLPPHGDSEEQQYAVESEVYQPPDSVLSIDEARPHSTGSARQWFPDIKPYGFAAAGLAGVILLALAGLLLFPADKPQQQGEVAKAAPAAMPEKSDRGDDRQAMKSLLSLNLPQDIEAMAINVVGSRYGAEHLGEHVRDGQFVLEKSVGLYSRDLIEVDPEKTYLMRLAFDVAAEEGNWPRLNAGVATFNGKEQLQRDDPGPHRYFVNTGRIDGRAAAKGGGEFTILNLISGTGNEGYDSFRPGTLYVRPVMIFQVNEGDKKLVLKQVEFLELR